MQYGGINTKVGKIRFNESSPLRNLRDHDATGTQWKRNRIVSAQDYSNENAIAQVSKAVQDLKRRIKGMPPTQLNLHPFQIYQPTNVPSFTKGVTFLGVGDPGVPTVCNIDSTRPTDFTAVPPTVNPTTDAWRFYAVRTGAIETRPIYDTGQLTNLESPDSSLFGIITACDNCDGIGLTESSTMQTALPPLVLAGDPVAGQSNWWEVWIRLLPDMPDVVASSPAIAITAKMNQPSTFGQVVADSPSQIFLAIIDTNGTAAPVTTWVYRNSNVLGRFPPGCGNFADASGFSGGNMNFRGTWNGTSTYFPTDLNIQIMYPGDVVWVSGTPNVMWQFTAKLPAFFSDGGGPPSSPNWSKVFST